MKFKEFIETYQNLIAMQKLEISAPIMENKKFHKAESCFSIPALKTATNNIASWQQVVDYQLYQLKCHLCQSWKNMLEDDGDCVSVFLDFLRDNVEVMSFMEKELLLFLVEEDKQKKLFYLSEDILCCKVVEEFLLSHSDNWEVQKVFQEMMQFKIQFFASSLSFSTNYQIFLHWMPQWKDIYPNVWNGIIQKLSEMKDKANLNCLEVRRLFEFYGLV